MVPRTLITMVLTLGLLALPVASVGQPTDDRPCGQDRCSCHHEAPVEAPADEDDCCTSPPVDEPQAEETSSHFQTPACQCCLATAAPVAILIHPLLMDGSTVHWALPDMVDRPAGRVLQVDPRPPAVL